MTTLIVHDIPDEETQALAARAARNGRSLEAEVRAILRDVVRTEPHPEEGGLATAIRRRFAPNGGRGRYVPPSAGREDGGLGNDDTRGSSHTIVEVWSCRRFPRTAGAGSLHSCRLVGISPNEWCAREKNAASRSLGFESARSDPRSGRTAVTPAEPPPHVGSLPFAARTAPASYSDPQISTPGRGFPRPLFVGRIASARLHDSRAPSRRQGPTDATRRAATSSGRARGSSAPGSARRSSSRRERRRIVLEEALRMSFWFRASPTYEHRVGRVAGACLCPSPMAGRDDPAVARGLWPPSTQTSEPSGASAGSTPPVSFWSRPGQSASTMPRSKAEAGRRLKPAAPKARDGETRHW